MQSCIKCLADSLEVGSLVTSEQNNNSESGSPGEIFGLNHSNSRRRVTSASSKARYASVGNPVHYTTGLRIRPKETELSNRF